MTDTTRPASGDRRPASPQKRGHIAVILDLYREGLGHQAIADRLNERGPAPPRAASWSRASIHSLIRRHMPAEERAALKQARTRQKLVEHTSIRLPADQLRWLTDRATEQGCTISDVIRALVAAAQQG